MRPPSVARGGGPNDACWAPRRGQCADGAPLLAGASGRGRAGGGGSTNFRLAKRLDNQGPAGLSGCEPTSRVELPPTTNAPQPRGVRRRCTPAHQRHAHVGKVLNLQNINYSLTPGGHERLTCLFETVLNDTVLFLADTAVCGASRDARSASFCFDPPTIP